MVRRKLKNDGQQPSSMPDTNKHLEAKLRPTPAFLFYSQQEYKAMRETNKPVDNAAKKDIGRRWKTLPKDEKQKFEEMARVSANEHNKFKASLPPKTRLSRNQSRISLGSIVLIVNRLSEPQRHAVNEIGLGGLLGIRCTRLNHELCEWLVEKFDPNSCSLNVHGCQLLLTPKGVDDILGIRSEGCDIELKGSFEGFEGLHEEVGVVNGVVPLNHLRLYLNETNDAGEEFKRKFALYILGALLCPNTKPALNLSLIHAVENVKAMESCNWAKFTLQSLVRGIGKYKNKGCAKATGCLFLLMLFYLDHVSPSSKTTYATRRSIPRLIDWGDSEIKETMRLFRGLGGFQNAEAEFNFTKGEPTQEHHADEGKTQHEDDRLTRIEAKIDELKSIMVLVLGAIWRQRVGVENRGAAHSVGASDVEQESIPQEVELELNYDTLVDTEKNDGGVSSTTENFHDGQRVDVQSKVVLSSVTMRIKPSGDSEQEVNNYVVGEKVVNECDITTKLVISLEKTGVPGDEARGVVPNMEELQEAEHVNNRRSLGKKAKREDSEGQKRSRKRWIMPDNLEISPTPKLKNKPVIGNGQ